VALKIGIGRVLIQLLPISNPDEEMKLPVITVNLVGGPVEQTIPTTLVTKPYTIEAYDSNDNYMCGQIGIKAVWNGATFDIKVYSVDPLNNIEFYITY
jgi:hypothetical protein